MSDMSMKVLAAVVANADLPAKEIMPAVSAAFPRETYALLKGYIYQLRDKGYLAVQCGDNRIVAIGVNASAYVALHEGNDAPAEKVSRQFNFNVSHVGQIHGSQFAMGNEGGSYDMRVSKNVVHAMSGGLREIIAQADKQSLNPFEREQLKKVLSQIIESLDKSEPVPQGLLERFDSFLQRHSWISAPLAAAFLNALSKLFSY